MGKNYSKTPITAPATAQRSKMDSDGTRSVTSASDLGPPKMDGTFITTQCCKTGETFRSITLASDLVPSKAKVKDHVQTHTKEFMKKYAPKAKSLITGTSEEHSAMERGIDRPATPGKGIIAVLGSDETIYSVGDCGLFAAVLTAYNNHWKLRTSPDDWWFCVNKRVACAIDRNATKLSVRKMFVDHAGKKTIRVEVPDDNIYTVNYSSFFDQISEGIRANVKVPEFVDGMTADFSTTSPVQRIASQITLMYSLQEYFRYSMELLCGIPAVEMLGTEDDWKKLLSKLKVLRTLLEPIEKELGLPSEWWDLVKEVFSKLLATYQGNPDTEWWNHVLSFENALGGSGMIIHGKYAYRGWITHFLEGTQYAINDISDMTTGLVTVPLTFVYPSSGVEDTAALVAGMMGFTKHTADDTEEVSVKPFQGWCLMLSEDSPFR